ncbi:hypothetical protein BCP18_073 [Bacillus phage BCP18]|nr:hypothetical protein BCP18_073 [Bacillus phage BCP18]
MTNCSTCAIYVRANCQTIHTIVNTSNILLFCINLHLCRFVCYSV